MTPRRAGRSQIRPKDTDHSQGDCGTGESLACRTEPRVRPVARRPSGPREKRRTARMTGRGPRTRKRPGSSQPAGPRAYPHAVRRPTIHISYDASHGREPQVGIEPTTARLRIECSTTELLWRNYRRQMAEDGWQQLPSAVCHLPSENALARIRTETPYGTTPSRWRVYQFHHQGNPNVFTFGYSNSDPSTIHLRRERRGSNPRPLE